MLAAAKPEIDQQIAAEQISPVHTQAHTLRMPGAEVIHLLVWDQLRMLLDTENAGAAA